MGAIDEHIFKDVRKIMGHSCPGSHGLAEAYRDWKDLGLPDPGSGGSEVSKVLREWHLYPIVSKVLCMEQKSFSNKVWSDLTSHICSDFVFKVDTLL